MANSKLLHPFTSFRAKISVIIIAAMLFAGAMDVFFIYPYALEKQFESIRQELMSIAQTAALSIDADKLMKIPLNAGGTSSQSFKDISEQLFKIKQASPIIHYIYTMTKTDKPGEWQFIVDIDASRNIQGPRTSNPGDLYNVARFEAMQKAFDGPQADKKLEFDEWGATLSGYAPIRDSNGKAVAIIGIDMSANDLHRSQHETKRRMLVSMLVGIALFLAVGMFISERISSPVKKLVEGTREVGQGKLDHTIELNGRDELSELAGSFNTMTKNLREARLKLTEYFYGVTQSLVRALEAKDTYIRGHSERVAAYSEKIAIELKLSHEAVELIRHTALLHDIGKLGIDESVLNKKGTLSPEEWRIIRSHPVIGEEILKPIAMTDELPAIIRTHHARFDGTGYPDKSDNEKINLYASIIAVADAYDAMVFNRSYRSALTHSAAAAELRKNSGTQFDPRAVKAFLAVLEKEGRGQGPA